MSHVDPALKCKNNLVLPLREGRWFRHSDLHERQNRIWDVIGDTSKPIRSTLDLY